MSENPEQRRRVRKRRSLGTLMNSQQRDTSLMGILRIEPKFRWALAGLVVFAITVASMLPKIWITSPDGFVPVVKVSGLDLLQARSLRRSAIRHAAAGETSEALQAWASAIANNLGDPQNLRGILNTVVGVDRLEQRWVGPALAQANWLLRLTNTNQSDLELACNVYQRQELHDAVVRLLGSTNRVLSPTGAGILAKSMFESGRMDLFGSHWDRYRDQLETHPDLQIYQWAWAAAWGPPVGMASGRAKLAEATQKPELAASALRLQLAVQAQRMDLAGFEETFKQLQNLRADRLTDHVRWWLLLDFLGRRQQALDRAKLYVTPPQTASEAEILLRVWARLELYDLAVDFGRTQMSNFQNASQLWLQLSRMLISAKKWDDLRSVALEIRNNHRMGRALGGYSYFLEGVAENGAGYRPRAEAAFANLVASPPEETMLTFEAASVIQRLGYPAQAKDLYYKLEKEMGDRLVFWQQMAQAAYETHQADLLIAACEKAHQLAPDNLVLANNHAAALLITRSNSTEALKLTLAVLSRAPESKIARINHALALAQIGRFGDSESELGKLTVTSLDEQETTFYHYALLDCAQGRGRLDDARRELDLIELRYLFPSQVEWVTSVRARLNRKAS